MPWLTITRPLNLLQAGLAVILTVGFLGEFGQIQTLVLLIFSVITINAGGNVINDIYDLEIDKINRPLRPLPAGRITIRNAWIYTLILFTAGSLAAAFISWSTFVIAGPLSISLLIAYSAKLKGKPLIGNIVVSFMLGLAFIYVGSAFGKIPETLVMAGLAFGFTLIREIVKDLEDMSGDAQAGARTLPLVLGELGTQYLLLILILLFMLLDVLPYIMGQYNQIYLYLVLWGVNLPLLVSAFILWQKASQKNYSRVQLFLKLDIFVGLAALYFGRII